MFEKTNLKIQVGKNIKIVKYKMLYKVKTFSNNSLKLEKIKEERKQRKPVLTEEQKKAYQFKKQKDLFS